MKAGNLRRRPLHKIKNNGGLMTLSTMIFKLAQWITMICAVGLSVLAYEGFRLAKEGPTCRLYLEKCADGTVEIIPFTRKDYFFQGLAYAIVAIIFWVAWLWFWTREDPDSQDSTLTDS
jgi:hypothetical protein